MKLKVRTTEQCKAYRKVRKQHQPIFRKLAKRVVPTDYGFMMEFVEEYLKYMADYYKNGCEVGGEAQGTKPRLQTINMALQLYRQWQDCEDEYFTLIEPSEVERYKRMGWTIPDTDRNKDALADLKGERWVWCQRYPDFHETTEKFVEEYNKRRKEFFKYVGEHLEEWWD